MPNAHKFDDAFPKDRRDDLRNFGFIHSEAFDEPEAILVRDFSATAVLR
jgi:hypothetical protein